VYIKESTGDRGSESDDGTEDEDIGVVEDQPSNENQEEAEESAEEENQDPDDDTLMSNDPKINARESSSVVEIPALEDERLPQQQTPLIGSSNT
jgi:hypothetical protein